MVYVNKPMTPAPRAGTADRKRSRDRREGHMAPALVAFHRELVRGIAAVRHVGGIEDVLEKRQA